MKSPILLLAVATTVIAPLCSAQDFVTVDGNAIHYEIKGSGEPWIVLVTGNGLALNSLDPIFDDLSKTTTVLRYSRAGLGKSAFDNKRKDFGARVHELQLLVTELSVPAPFILGGHSFGGLITRAFAGRNPGMVAGLLSIDPAFEDNWAVLEPFDPDIRSRYLTPLAYFLETRPDSGTTHEFASMVDFYDSPEQWRDWLNYPRHIPHFVITSQRTTEAVNSPGRRSRAVMEARAQAQFRLIANSRTNMQLRLPNAGHEVYNDQPQAVVDAFVLLLNLVRNGDGE
jgi:pimeloyl-ACP methyl ester carboxylesterase